MIKLATFLREIRLLFWVEIWLFEANYFWHFFQRSAALSLDFTVPEHEESALADLGNSYEDYLVVVHLFNLINFFSSFRFRVFTLIIQH